MSTSDVANDLRERRLLPSGNVEVADGEETGRTEEMIDSIEKSIKVGHHATKSSARDGTVRGGTDDSE